MKLSVNILCWNNRACVEQTLKVLKHELEDIDHEIIICDNGSSDGTIDIDTTGTTYIRNEQNRGISHGKNQGLDVSKGDYIMLMDGDIIPIPGSITKFMEFLDETLEADAIGFYPNKGIAQINKNGQKHHEERCENLFQPKLYDCHCIYFGMYRRRVFDTIRFCTDGAFGEVGYGWEDFDFYEQMVRAGFSQWVTHINNAKGRYFHNINSSIRTMGRMKFRESTVARRKLYYERWGDARQANPCTS